LGSGEWEEDPANSYNMTLALAAPQLCFPEPNII